MSLIATSTISLERSIAKGLLTVTVTTSLVLVQAKHTNAVASKRNNFFILLNQLIIEKRIMDYEDIENGKNG
jgi:hypothetical protein